MNLSDLELNLRWLATYHHLVRICECRSVVREVRKSHKYASTWLVNHGVSNIAFSYLRPNLVLVSCLVGGNPYSLKVNV